MDSLGTVIKAVNTFGANGLLSRWTPTSNTFYTFDPQGSVCQRFDRTGNRLSSDMYDSYGALQSQTPSGVGDVFGYGAQYGAYTDPEDGLVLLTNRYYDPGTGRFLNRDPLGQAGGANLYGYVGNNPASSADPLGLVSRGQYVTAGAAVGGLAGVAAGAGRPARWAARWQAGSWAATRGRRPAASTTRRTRLGRRWAATRAAMPPSGT
jgi:RHS repeat-associated protein